MLSNKKPNKKPANKRAATQEDQFDQEAQQQADEYVTLETGTKVRVYWTGLRKWYTAKVTSSRMVTHDGETYRATRVVYDASDGWTRKDELTYVHCLEDVTWSLL